MAGDSLKNWIGKKRTSFASVPGWPLPRRKAGRRRFVFNSETNRVEEERPDDPLTEARELRRERYWREK